MRKIRNTNSHIEFLECKDNGDIINSKGFQLGEICYQLTPQKVTFYLETADNPFSTMVWSIDLPFEFNDVTVSTTEEAADALQGIMVLDDLSKIREDLDNEILRSTNKDTEHDVLISGLTDDLEDEIARATSAETALNDKIDAEILRSTNKDTEHDTLISGLTDVVNSEIQRAISAETRLEDKIDAEVSRAIQKENAILNKVNLNTERISGLSDALDVEIQNRIAADAQLQNVISIEADDRRHADALLKSLIDELGEDLEDETARALSAETRLEDKIDAAISADTRIEQKLDDEISRAYSAETLINQALANEVVRAVSAETRIEIKLDNEIQERKDADIVLSGAIDSLSAYCEDTYAKKEDLEALEDKVDEAISGLTDDLQAEIARATAREDDIAEDLEDEFHRAQSAEHLLEDKIVTERERAIGVEDELRELIISGGTGSGITSAQVQTMIENYTYDKEYIDDKQDKVSIWNGTGMNAVIVNNSGNTASQNYAFAEGVSNRATNTAAHAEGMGNVASGGFSHAEGRNTTASQIAAHTEGTGTQAKGTDSHAEGTYTIAYNNSEHASGYYNVSRTGSTDADKTLFSVGNGTSSERHNALEVRYNGDIYITSGESDVKLQDYLGGGSGGSGVTSGEVMDMISGYAYSKTETSGKTEIQNALDDKQDILSAGTGISIANNVISTSGSVTEIERGWDDIFGHNLYIIQYGGNNPGPKIIAKSGEGIIINREDGEPSTYTGAIRCDFNKVQRKLSAGDNIDITDNVISTVTKFWCGTQAQYDAITIKDPNTVYMIHD